jgi:CRP-like cAMP-binding protein
MASAQPRFPSSTDVLVNRFNRLEPLSEQERVLLRLIEGKAKHAHPPDTRLLTEKSEMGAPHFIMTGWAARVRELKGGRRQIIGILIPGDAIGLVPRTRPLSPASVLALTPMRTVAAPEIAVAWRERARVPGLSAALDLAAAEEEYFLLGQIMRLGRQTAYDRIAHWFMELDFRLAARGLSTNNAFAFPLKQEMLADAAGLSVVHVNRTLQQMRREGRIELKHGRLSLLDKEALSAAAEFRPPVLSASRSAMAGGELAVVGVSA